MRFCEGFRLIPPAGYLCHDVYELDAFHWGYQKSQAYRHVQAGSLLARLEQSHSPIGENSGITESHLRPVYEMVPEALQVECWKEVSEHMPDGVKPTAALVKKETQRFLQEKGVEPKQKKRQQPAKPDAPLESDNSDSFSVSRGHGLVRRS